MTEKPKNKEGKSGAAVSKKKKSGKRTVKGPPLRFDSPEAVRFYRKTLERFGKEAKNYKTVLLLPCAATKPIQTSPTHCFLAPVGRIKREDIGVFIVSEPLTLIPYDAKEYPNYEYPPAELRRNKEEKRKFVERLKKFWKKLPEDTEVIYIGGKHHAEILKESGLKFKAYIPEGGIRGYNRKAKELLEYLRKKYGDKSLGPTLRFKVRKISREKIELEPIISRGSSA